MGARTGQEYIDRLAASRPTVEIMGERVSANVPDHPAFRNVVRTYAQLYDLQHSEPEVLTYESPTSGDPVGTSFLVPRTEAGVRIQLTAAHTDEQVQQLLDALTELAGFLGGGRR